MRWCCCFGQEELHLLTDRLQLHLMGINVFAVTLVVPRPVRGSQVRELVGQIAQVELHHQALLLQHFRHASVRVVVDVLLHEVLVLMHIFQL